MIINGFVSNEYNLGFDPDFSNMERRAKLPGNTNNTKTLIYAGEQSFTTQYGKVMSWKEPLNL